MPTPTLRQWLGIELVEVSKAEKAVATVGGMLAILALIAISTAALPTAAVATAVVASMGASAVLLFGVPHGPLSQPWPVMGGHGVSAVIGVLCARYIPHTPLAAAVAVGLAIGAMHQLKCIHPPGGATAFTAVMGGPAIHDLGFDFVLFPVLANAGVMVALAVLINGLFRWRRYPAILSRPARATATAPAAGAPTGPTPTHEDVLNAIRSLDSFIDISEEDLLRLTRLLSPAIPSPPAASRPPANADTAIPGSRPTSSRRAPARV